MKKGWLHVLPPWAQVQASHWNLQRWMNDGSDFNSEPRVFVFNFHQSNSHISLWNLNMKFYLKKYARNIYIYLDGFVPIRYLEVLPWQVKKFRKDGRENTMLCFECGVFPISISLFRRRKKRRRTNFLVSREPQKKD